jgi:hypothetical protein
LVAVLSTVALFLYPRSRFFFRRMYEEGAGGVLLVAGIIELYLILTGVGVLTLRRWGFYLFKSLLYLFLVLGFPLFTILCWLMLSYIRRRRIDRYFSSA